MLANHKKEIFPLKRAFLGESQIEFQVLGRRYIKPFGFSATYGINSSELL